MSDDARRAERLADYHAGRMDPTEAARFEGELLEEPALAEGLYAEINLDAGLGAVAAAARGGRAETPRRARRAGRSPWRWALPAVAAAALVTLLVMREPPQETFRGGADIVPSGEFESFPERFTWGPVDGAVRYRVEFADPRSGELLFTALVEEPQLELSAPQLADAPARAIVTVTPEDEIGRALAGPRPVSVVVQPRGSSP